jgi:tRNA G18 (ribose-2'-O)-methylase SpoU
MKLKSNLKNKKREVIVICHNIRSAFNVGSIFRTADGAGISKIILGGYSAHPPHPKLVKTALGAEKSMSYERVWHTWRLIEKLKKQGYYIIGLEKSAGAKNIFSFKPKFPLVLLLGNEVNGLSKEISRRCDDIVFIPMRGKKESLNVSVAFRVAIYELTKNL